MKDDKWICHTGKEITLSSSDRLAWFARAGVPKSLVGGEKRVGFQVRPTSQLLPHLPPGWVWGIFIRSLIPSNLSIRTPPTGQGVGLPPGEAPSCFQHGEHSVNSSPQLPPSMVWDITAASAWPPTGQPLFSRTCVLTSFFFFFFF